MQQSGKQLNKEAKKSEIIHDGDKETKTLLKFFGLELTAPASLKNAGLIYASFIIVNVILFFVIRSFVIR